IVDNNIDALRALDGKLILSEFVLIAESESKLSPIAQLRAEPEIAENHGNLRERRRDREYLRFHYRHAEEAISPAVGDVDGAVAARRELQLVHRGMEKCG